MPAYLLQTHEMLFDAHNHAFRVFGGIPGRGIYDNMRTAIDKVGRGKERDVSVRFMAMVTCSSQSSAIRRPAGRRSRRTCRMRAIGSFSCSHAFRHSKP